MSTDETSAYLQAKLQQSYEGQTHERRQAEGQEPDLQRRREARRRTPTGRAAPSAC